MDKVNPTAEMLAGVMMLEYLGWQEAAVRLRDAVRKVVASKVVTYDLARQMPGSKEVRTSVFAQAVVDAIHGALRGPAARDTSPGRNPRPPCAEKWSTRGSRPST